MALIHNAILRGFNTIYLQAPHVKPVDYADFIGYSLTWSKFVKKHHDDEEEELFPQVEAILGDKGVFDSVFEEHSECRPCSRLLTLVAIEKLGMNFSNHLIVATFMDGLTKFHDYLAPLSEQGQESGFSASTLLSIMDSFKEAFCNHFHSEISTIAALAEKYSEKTDLSATLGPTFAKWGKSSIMGAGYTDAVPFLFLNFDRTAEDGKWANWPPMPGPIRWMLVNFCGFWYSGRWRFASCGYDGKPKTLYALGE